MRLQSRALLIFLSLGHSSVDVCQGAIPALLPVLLTQRQLSYTAAAGLILAVNMVSSIIQPLFGYIADRHWIPWLMSAGVLTAGAGLALSCLFSNYWLIALCLGVCGLGIAAYHPQAARMVHEMHGQQKATSMSIFSLGGTIGFAVGPLIMTGFLFLFGLNGTAALFPFYIGIALLLFFVFSRFVRSEPAAKATAGGSEGDRTNQWLAFSCLMVVIVCRSVIFYGLNTFLALYWIHVLNQPQVVGATALSVLLFTGVAGTVLGGRLADRYGRRRVILLAFAVLFPVLMVFVLVSTWNMFLAWALLIPIGLCLFAPTSVTVVMGQEYLPSHVGTASGVTLGLAITIGGLVAPLLGRVADQRGIPSALFVLAWVPVLAFAFAMLLPREEKILHPLPEISAG